MCYLGKFTCTRQVYRNSGVSTQVDNDVSNNCDVKTCVHVSKLLHMYQQWYVFCDTFERLQVHKIF